MGNASIYSNLAEQSLHNDRCSSRPSCAIILSKSYFLRYLIFIKLIGILNIKDPEVVRKYDKQSNFLREKITFKSIKILIAYVHLFITLSIFKRFPICVSL